MGETSKKGEDTTPPPETHPGARRKRLCKECGGLGHSVEAPGAPCQTCHGTGKQRG